MSDKGTQMHFNEQRIDEILSRFGQCREPGAAVGIAVDGQVRYRKGFGLANMEMPVVLTPTTKMRIGSTSKHFVALAYMLFVERGAASLDDPLSLYLPALDGMGDVTIRQLMGHIGGIRCSMDLLTSLNGIGIAPSTSEQVELLERQQRLNFTPGERWSYSNGGYVLLSRIVETLAGASLEQVLKTEIFDRIGMLDTMLRRTDSGFVPNSACPHFIDAQGAFVRSPFRGDIAGEGGIVSTVDDMLRWLAHMDRPVVGSASTWAQLAQPLTLSNGASTGYGLGLFSSVYRGARILHHPGGVFGASAQMVKVLDHGLDVIVMINRADADPVGLAERIIDACVPGLAEVPADAPRPPKTGTYYSADSGTVVRLLERQGKQFMAVKGFDLPAKTDPDGTLHSPMTFLDLSISFPVQSDAPSVIELSDHGITERLARIEPDARTSGPVLGEFESAETQTQASIYRDGNGEPRLEFRSDTGGFQYGLTCIGPMLWTATSLDPSVPFLGGTVEIDADRSRLRFSTGRTSRLEFHASDRSPVRSREASGTPSYDTRTILKASPKDRNGKKGT